MSMRNLQLLVPRPPLIAGISRWATVTQISPLRIKLDGESVALPFTPDTLVGSLAVNDRVLATLATNDDPVFKARRVIVIGKAGGHNHAAADIASGTLALARIPTGTTSSTVALGNHTHAANRLWLSKTSYAAPDGTGTAILFPTPDRNIGSFTYATGTGKANVPVDGDYEIFVRGVWNSPTGSNSGATDIYVNIGGTDYWLNRVISRGSDGAKAVFGGDRFALVTTQDIYFKTFQNANGGSTLSLDIFATINFKG